MTTIMTPTTIMILVLEIDYCGYHGSGTGTKDNLGGLKKVKKVRIYAIFAIWALCLGDQGLILGPG